MIKWKFEKGVINAVKIEAESVHERGGGKKPVRTDSFPGSCLTTATALTGMSWGTKCFKFS